MTGAEAVFLDTNVLVAATVEAHPSHQLATALLGRIADRAAAVCVSPQVCREYLAVLTRAPVEGRTFTNGEALEALTVSLEGCAVLDETVAVLDGLLDLVARRGVRGRQVHDANIVATMVAHRVTRLATLDSTDFRRFEDLVSLEPVSS